MNQVWKISFAVIITAIIVGGGVYYWQQSRLFLMEQSLQQQINSLQSQIEGFQQTVSTSETTQESTLSSDENTNWRTYENKELGFSFGYPASYGDFQISINAGETGKKFIGNFSNNKYFSIGGITEDFTASRSANFMDFVKYLNDDGKYYHLLSMVFDKKYLVEPIKILIADSQKILVLGGNSYVGERDYAEGPQLNPGSNVGALINIPGSGEFNGIAVWNYEVKTLPQSEFEKILMTFKFTKDETGHGDAQSEETSPVEKEYTESFNIGGLSFILPEDWNLQEIVTKNNKEIAKIKVPDPAYNVIVPMQVSVIDHIIGNGDSFLRESSSGVKIYENFCAPAIACYYLVYKNNTYSVLFETVESDQYVPDNLDGVWGPNTTITKEDTLNFVSTAR